MQLLNFEEKRMVYEAMYKTTEDFRFSFFSFLEVLFRNECATPMGLPEVLFRNNVRLPWDYLGGDRLIG